MQTAWPYPIGKYRTKYLQIDFYLVSEYCKTTRDAGLCNSIAHEIKMLRIQHGFPSVIFLIVVANGYVLETFIGA